MSHRHVSVAYCLWFFLGVFGIHRFYLGRPLSGVIYLLTGGLFLIGWFIDLFLIPGMVEHFNHHNAYRHPHHHHEVVYVAQPAYNSTPYQGAPVYVSSGPTY
eukprot:TRINITY_DN131_c0_g1_i1.p1 TRINITY_DN131_c0_g1~~TRINITY_DN131_c0_g1_i1.p1  ORF type:complete len:102 (+),score=3.52 TRINITY_DN131_c0_g1_i1:328-633(+)